MNLGLEGKRAVVTGAARGIGLATARMLLEEGAHVLVNDIDAPRLQQALDELRQVGPRVAAAAADASAPAGAEQIFAEADKAFGGTDILINNAGVYRHATALVDVRDEEWDEVFQSNLRSVQLCSRQAVERMASVGGGVILNASSFAAVSPTVGGGVYAASKAAVISLTRTMAAEFAPLGVRVNAYIPGVIATDMTAPLIAVNEEKMLEQIALRRFGAAEEVAAPLVFLASERASYISGAVLEITGGKLVAQRPEAAWRNALATRE
jgi:NAD(P)-dependent dehydrogenase (short-subunit alcohol dehydrogenase family)